MPDLNDVQTPASSLTPMLPDSAAPGTSSSKATFWPLRRRDIVALFVCVGLAAAAYLVVHVRSGAQRAELARIKSGLTEMSRREVAHNLGQTGSRTGKAAGYVEGHAMIGKPLLGFEPDSSYRMVVRTGTTGSDTSPGKAWFYAAAMSRQLPNQLCIISLDTPRPMAPATQNGVPACSPDLGGRGAPVWRVLAGELFGAR